MGSQSSNWQQEVKQHRKPTTLLIEDLIKGNNRMQPSFICTLLILHFNSFAWVLLTFIYYTWEEVGKLISNNSACQGFAWHGCCGGFQAFCTNSAVRQPGCVGYNSVLHCMILNQSSELSLSFLIFKMGQEYQFCKYCYETT